MSVDVDADLVSQFRVTLTVTDGTRSDTASVDFAGKYVCYLAVEESVDLRSGSGGLNVSAFDCVGDAHATISYPGWIHRPGHAGHRAVRADVGGFRGERHASGRRHVGRRDRRDPGEHARC